VELLQSSDSLEIQCSLLQFFKLEESIVDVLGVIDVHNVILHFCVCIALVIVTNTLISEIPVWINIMRLQFYTFESLVDSNIRIFQLIDNSFVVSVFRKVLEFECVVSGGEILSINHFLYFLSFGEPSKGAKELDEPDGHVECDYPGEIGLEELLADAWFAVGVVGDWAWGDEFILVHALEHGVGSDPVEHTAEREYVQACEVQRFVAPTGLASVDLGPLDSQVYLDG